MRWKCFYGLESIFVLDCGSTFLKWFYSVLNFNILFYRRTFCIKSKRFIEGFKIWIALKRVELGRRVFFFNFEMLMLRCFYPNVNRKLRRRIFRAFLRMTIFMIFTLCVYIITHTQYGGFPLFPQCCAVRAKSSYTIPKSKINKK